MIGCFADTFYFFALLNPRDEAHLDAIRITANLNRPIVTTAWVLTELADGLAATSSRFLFARFLTKIQAENRTTIVPPSQSLFEQAAQLYDSRSDKQWSLTDCTSMIVMQQHGLQDVLTGDHHFRQAGFNLLFK